MESRRGDTDTMGRAAELLASRGRIYRHGRNFKYLTVQFFSKDIRECRLLVKHLGGNYYKHGVGYSWVVSSRKGIQYLLDTMPPSDFTKRLEESR